jgi:hypothetical protein
MLFWLVDNVLWVLIFFGMAGAALAVGWWNTRNRPLLVAAAAVVAVMAALFLVSLFVVTDRKQLVRNVENLRDTYNAGKIDEALGFFADDIAVETAEGTKHVSRDGLKVLATLNQQSWGLQGINTKKIVINSIEVVSVNRPNAEVHFYVRPEDEPGAVGRCVLKYTREPSGEWRINGIHVESVVGGQKGPLILFGGGK